MTTPNFLRIAIPPEVYRLIEARAAASEKLMNQWLRDVIFQELGLRADTYKDALPPEAPGRINPTKRAILEMLSSDDITRPSDTQDLLLKAHCSEQSVYIALRALHRAGLIERGVNRPRGLGGAPCKTWLISETGRKLLTDDQNKIRDVHEAFQRRSVSSAVELGVLKVVPAFTPEQQAIQRDDAHHNLRYIAMSVDKSGDVKNAVTAHKRLCDNADRAVEASKSTWAALNTEIVAKIEALGGPDAVKAQWMASLTPNPSETDTVG